MAVIPDRKFTALREAVSALQNGCTVDLQHAAITVYAKEAYDDDLALSEKRKESRKKLRVGNSSTSLSKSLGCKMMRSCKTT